MEQRRSDADCPGEAMRGHSPVEGEVDPYGPSAAPCDLSRGCRERDQEDGPAPCDGSPREVLRLPCEVPSALLPERLETEGRGENANKQDRAGPQHGPAEA